LPRDFNKTNNRVSTVTSCPSSHTEAETNPRKFGGFNLGVYVRGIKRNTCQDGKKRVRVPPEILDRIFNHLGQEPRGDDAPLDSDFEPQRLLHPLLFVWHEIALRRFYSSAGVAYDIESVSARETVVVERFRTTIKDSPRLASLVKELRVSFPFAYKDTTQTLVDLLSLCKRVIRVTIAIFYYGQLEGDGELLNALAELDLVALDLSGFETLRTPSEFITFMLKWPNLRKINIRCGFKGQDDPSILPAPSTVRGRCPVLREIAFPWFYIHTKNLNVLCEMAPNVEKLNARPHSCTTEALPSCLRTWSSNLTTLSLGVCGTPTIASLCPKIGRLRDNRHSRSRPCATWSSPPTRNCGREKSIRREAW